MPDPEPPSRPPARQGERLLRTVLPARVAAWPAGRLLAAYWAVLAIGTHLPKWDHKVPSQPLLPLDKPVHGALFAGLTFLLYRVLLRWRPGAPSPPQTLGLLAAVIVSGYSVADEYTQGWVGRTVDSSDLLANFAGAFGAYLVIATPNWLTARPGWLTQCVRVLWLVVCPPLVMLTLLPAGPTDLEPLKEAIHAALGVDKGLHFVLGGLLTWLLAASAPMTRSRPRLGVAVTLAVMFFAAPVIEWVQRHTGRSAQMEDIVAHNRGVLLAMGGWVVLVALHPLLPAAVAAAGFRAVGGAADARPGRDGADADANTDANTDDRFVGHAVLVSALTLLSRLTGLVRDAVLAAMFGLGAVADAFFLGFLVPNLFRRLFGEGALSAAFIPIYTELNKRDPDRARRFASLSLGLLMAVLCGVTLVGELGLAAMLRHGVGAGGWSDRAVLTIRLTMIMLPFMPMVCGVALMGGLLQVHGRFGPPAAASIVLNACMIGFTLWAGLGVASTAESRDDIAVVTAGSVLVAGLIQFGWLLIAVQRVTRLTAVVRGAARPLGRMVRLMGPMVLGLAVFQINTLADMLIAMWFSPPEMPPGGIDAAGTMLLLGREVAYPLATGDIAAIGWAQRLYQFPLGVFAIAIATAIYPALARAAPGRTDDPAATAAGLDRFANILRHGLRLTVFIGLPASVGLMIVRQPLARLIYEWGQFSADDAGRVAAILLGYAAAVWAYSTTQVATRGFYALQDTTTPVKVAVAMVVLNFAMNLTLIWPLGAAGLAWSTATTATLQVVVLLWLLARRVPDPVDTGVRKSWTRTAVLSAAMAGVLLPAVLILDPAGMRRWESVALLGGLIVAGGAVVLGGALATRAPELRWLRRRSVS